MTNEKYTTETKDYAEPNASKRTRTKHVGRKALALIAGVGIATGSGLAIKSAHDKSTHTPTNIAKNEVDYSKYHSSTETLKVANETALKLTKNILDLYHNPPKGTSIIDYPPTPGYDVSTQNILYPPGYGPYHYTDGIPHSLNFAIEAPATEKGERVLYQFGVDYQDNNGTIEFGPQSNIEITIGATKDGQNVEPDSMFYDYSLERDAVNLGDNVPDEYNMSVSYSSADPKHPFYKFQTDTLGGFAPYPEGGTHEFYQMTPENLQDLTDQAFTALDNARQLSPVDSYLPPIG